MKRTACGPGLLAIPAPAAPDGAPEFPWVYDYATHEIVRVCDGRRWSASDVPELRRSIEEWATNPVVDVDEVDRWVLAQRDE